MVEEYKNLINVDCDCVLNTEALLIAEACQLLQVLKSIFPYIFTQKYVLFFINYKTCFSFNN